MHGKSDKRRVRRSLGLVMAFGIVVSLVGGLFGAQSAAAANGFSISSGVARNNRPAVAASKDGTKLCVAWATFDADAEAFIRHYDIPSNTWSPALSEAAVNLSNSKGEATSIARCAFDGAGRVHATWTEGSAPNARIEHRYLEAGRANTIANWSAKTAISPRGSAQHAALDGQHSDATGKVWAVYVEASGDGNDLAAKVWTPSGWTDGGRVTNYDDNAKAHYPFVAVDDAGYVHVAYGQSGTRYAYRDAASGAWVGRVAVPGAAGAFSQAGIAVNRPTGDVHIAYAKYATSDTNGPRLVGYAKKTGSTGTAFATANTNLNGDKFFVPRVALAGGKVVVAADGAGSASRAIAYVVSDNGGGSFGGRTLLTDGAVSANWVGLAGDGGGNAYFAYRNTLTNNINFTSTAAISAPGGGADPTPAPADPTPTTAPGTATPTRTPTVTPSPTATPSPTPVRPVTPPTIPGDQSRKWCPVETGQCVTGDFLVYWETRGGLALHGFPISEPFVEQLEDGKFYTVQYFERARMEYHPENNAPYQIELGHFGRRIHKERLGREADQRAQASAGQTYYEQTGHNVPANFQAYWQANGGLDTFGYPVTEVFTETLEDGKPYQVQYFERARFELHPENGAPFDILLGQFGRQILGAR